LLNQISPNPEETQPTRIQRTGQRLWKTLRGVVRRAAPFVGGIAAALLALWLYHYLVPPPQPLTVEQVSTVVAQSMGSATPAPPFSVGAYQAVQPSFVYIQAHHPASAEKKEANGLGSGVIINADGAILTSLHVVDGADEVTVTFADGSSSSAEVAVRQEENDIAVLQPRTPPAQVIPAVLGDPNALQVGDEIYAVGNPFGLYASMSAGIVSGLNRSFRPPNSGQRLEGLIQIDSAVNPGNSGGPLLNRYGQVVGIVVGIVNPTDQDVFIGIGFAVPINIAGGAVGLPSY
jgi:S1-C subfamily serine protease